MTENHFPLILLSTVVKLKARTKEQCCQSSSFALPHMKHTLSKSLSFSSVQSLSNVRLFGTPWTAACQGAFCPLPTPRVYSDSCTLRWWCHPTISSSVVPSPPALNQGVFTSQFFTSGGQSITVSASASVLPINIQDWFLLGWTGWISLLFKGLSKVFSNNTVQSHQFFGTQLSL